jgi:hypothetical protein
VGARPRRTGFERGLDGAGNQLRGRRVDADFPTEQWFLPSNAA